MRRASGSVAATLVVVVVVAAAGARAQSDAGTACGAPADWAPAALRTPAVVVQEWEAEAAAAATIGSPASFDLQGVDVHLVGEGLVVEAGQSITALVLQQGQAGNDYLFVEDATVNGQQGTLVVQGPRITVSGALSASFHATEVRGGTPDAPSVVQALPALTGGMPLSLTFSEEWAGAGWAASSVARSGVDLDGTTLSGFTRAMLVTSTGEVALGSSVVVTAGGAVSTRVGGTGSEVLVVEATTLSATGDKLAIAGDMSSGTATVGGTALATTPAALMLRDGPVVVRSNGAAAADVRATQALGADGAPLLTAAVEAAVGARYVRVAENGRVYLPIAVREAGLAHDALFAGIEVEGCVGVDAVQAVVDDDFPGFVQLLVSVIPASGWAAPIVAVAVIATLPGAILLDAFVSILDGLSCLFGCPTPPPPPEPYPAWLEPGEARLAELVVRGTAPAGDYPTRIKLLGKNHPPVVIDLLVRVGAGDVPDTWGCSVDAYGSLGACDCGCGAPDADCASTASDACETVWCADTASAGLGGLVDPLDATTCLQPPTEWTCDGAFFAAGDDVCDCGCGVADPDCGADATAAACDVVRCAWNGSGAGGEGGRLVDGDATTCLLPPAGWACGEAAYGDGDCDCGCGGDDVDCAADATPASCAATACPSGTTVDPNALGFCVAPASNGGGGGFDEDDSGDDDDSDDVRLLDCAATTVPDGDAPLAIVAPALAALVALRRRRRRR